MATNVSTLIRDWIQFLKLNQITGPKPDPTTGKLIYKRKVTAGDVSRFLSNNTNFSDDEINEVIAGVLKPRKPRSNKDSDSEDNTKALPNGSNAVATVQSGRPAPKPPSQIKHDPNSISDIDYRDINEAFTEFQSPDVSEKQVEKIFNILMSRSPASAGQRASTSSSRRQQGPESRSNVADTPDPETNANSEEERARKEEAVRKIKRLIRDTMTDGQRVALWRALNEV